MTNSKSCGHTYAPSGKARLDHLPTVKMAHAYWEAVLGRSPAGSGAGRTAATFCRIYAAARDALRAAEGLVG